MPSPSARSVSPGPAAAREAAIEARGLDRRFGEVRALDGLTLTVPVGELYGLIGPNGSGKTTLIRILMGLDAPTAGDARILGRRPSDQARILGYMPQEQALYPDLSVQENLAFFGGLYGGVPGERIREVLEFVHLWDVRDRLVAHLSGGMRQRASLAVALVHAPRVVFLDEPTVGVDPLLRHEFWDGFRRLAREGATLVITTHHLEEARRCDRVGLLWRGRIIQEGAPDALLAGAGTHSLEEAFVHYVREARHER